MGGHREDTVPVEQGAGQGGAGLSGNVPELLCVGTVGRETICDLASPEVWGQRRRLKEDKKVGFWAWCCHPRGQDCRRSGVLTGGGDMEKLSGASSKEFKSGPKTKACGGD